MILLLFAFLCLCAARPSLSNSNQHELNILNVHIVPHTHDDVGWLKTVDQYYYGRNNSIQHACVSCILDSVVYALQLNPNRTFTYVEMAFFSMWWDEQTPQMRDIVRQLVASGQLSFANGGWCMHDEATTHYMGMIDQMTMGHSFLLRELNYTPSVGWQLDPFGHSKFNAFMSRLLGFNSMYFGRIDYQDLKKRQETKNCEGIWDSDIFFSLTGSYGGNYGPPLQGFCFDVNCADEPLVGLNHDQLIARVTLFMDAIKLQASRTRGNHLLITMGEDFQYENAFVNYKNIDILIETLNNLPRNLANFLQPDFDGIRVFYSSPEIYSRDKYYEWKRHNVTRTIDLKYDDFFPYSDCEHCFWTGYFTSRPLIKRLDRLSSALLNSARKIEVLYRWETKSNKWNPFYYLSTASGILQHHDGVSGTSKQHVADDYTNKIYRGIQETTVYLSNIVTRMIQPWNFTYCESGDTCELPLLRNKTDAIHLAIFNPLSFVTKEFLSIKVQEINCLYTLEHYSDGAWNQVSYSIMSDQDELQKPVHLLYFQANLSALGFSLYRVSSSSPNTTSDSVQTSSTTFTSTERLRKAHTLSQLIKGESQFIQLRNEFLTAQVEKGLLTGITLIKDDLHFDINHTYGFYKSWGTMQGQNSGAYIFRPSKPNETLTPLDPRSVQVFQSDLLTEVRTDFVVPWMKQVIKLYHGLPYLDIEYSVGPIPVEMDGIGKEVVTMICSNIKNNGIFYTDSNGRQFIRRERSKRSTWSLNEFEPIAGNYYPINTAIYIRDDERSLALLTDRSQGGGSLADGCVEVMLHRRTVYDDARGVGEALNETDQGMSPYPPYGDGRRKGQGLKVHGKLRLVVGKAYGEQHVARSHLDSMFATPLMFSASASIDASVKIDTLSALSSDLPENINIISLERWSSDSILLRMAHQYDVDESVGLSAPVQVDLSSLFTKKIKIASVAELMLSGNQLRSEWENSRRLSWLEYERATSSSLDEGFIVYMRPLEIRTFKVTMGNA